MESSLRRQAFTLYLFLAALFITSLVVSNLIFQKFFFWQPFGELTVFGAPIFEVSVGILPYPITFLITDLISEIFGKKMANKVVVAGIFTANRLHGCLCSGYFVVACSGCTVHECVWKHHCGRLCLDDVLPARAVC